MTHPPAPDPRLMSHVTRDRGSHHVSPNCCKKSIWKKLKTTEKKG